MPGERIAFRPIEERDHALVGAWLAAPHVARWFGEVEEWLEEIRGERGAGWTWHYVAEIDGVPRGFAQCYRTDRAPPGPWSGEPPGTLGIDFCLGRPEDLGRGLGSVLVRALARFAAERHAPRRLIADPDPANAASTRTLAASGFVLDAHSGLWALDL